MTLAGGVVIMRYGVVQQIGPPIEIYDRPGNLFIASFTDSPPMNLIRGRISDGRLEEPDLRIDGPDAVGARPSVAGL